MKKIIYQPVYPLNFLMEVEFNYENARVFTIDALSKLDQNKGQNEKDAQPRSIYGYLVVEIIVEIKDFESVNDAAAHARPMLLVILSILSLLSDFPFTSFMSPQLRSWVADELSESDEVRFILGEDQDDWSNELRNILTALTAGNQSKKRLIYSLIDRWRKARHMQEESKDSMEYDDEVVIAYFHVMELLATEYYGGLKVKIKAQVNTYLDKIYSNLLLFEGEYLKTTIASKIGLTEQIVLDGLPISGKVLFALNELGISGSRLKFLINNLIKDRNSVAHGKNVYQDRIIFPVPPFFPNAKLSDYTLDTLKILAAHSICRFANSERYTEEWDIENSYLVPTLDEIKSFVNEEKYKGLSNSDFANGTVNIGSISWALVDKKISLKEGLKILSECLKYLQSDEDEISQLVLAAALMADVAKDDQLLQCEKILVIASTQHWHLFGNMRDVLSFLEYNGWNPKYLEKMISDKKLR